MIVVDLGSEPHNGSDSVRMLIDRFHPDVLYGFDPLGPVVSGREVDGTILVLSDRAAWTHDGTIEFQADGVASCLVVDREPLLHESYQLNPIGLRQVECFDLAAFIEALPNTEIVVKFDVESAEIPLLEHLMDAEVDGKLSRVLVEWHPGTALDWVRRSAIEEFLACPIEAWSH